MALKWYCKAAKLNEAVTLYNSDIFFENRIMVLQIFNKIFKCMNVVYLPIYILIYYLYLNVYFIFLFKYTCIFIFI